MDDAPLYREIELNALDPETRKRFIGALDGSNGPTPILSQPSSTGGAIFGWLVLATIGAAGGLVLAYLDFGEPGGFSQAWYYMLGYALCALFALWGVLGAVRAAVLAKALPFKRGRYVFPTDMVIATDSTLRIVPMGRLLKLDGVHRHTNGVYQGTDLNFQFEGYGREYFVVRGKELAEQILDDLRDAQQRISDAVQLQDLNAIHALDVFFEARGKDYWNDPAMAAQRAKTPEVATMGFGLSADGRLADRDASPNDTTLAKPVSPILARAGTVSLAAMLLAPPFWLGRNFASDEAAFANARARNRTYAFNAYVWEDGRHRQEVIDRWLPEAAFAEAQEAGTVSALRDFVRAHPSSARVNEARQAIHQRFVQVRQDFLSQAATGDPRMPVFMGRLLDWLEAHDSPPVRVRFLAPSAEALAIIDQNLDVFGEVQGVTGGIAPVAPHFTAQRSTTRESNITRVLQQGFAPVFPSDVMQLEHAGRVGEAEQSAALTQPAFDVSYTIRPSGSVYTSDTSTRGFVGIHVDFHIQMRIPGDADTWGVDTSVEPPEHFTVTSYGYVDPSGDSAYRDGLVYSVMADRAFDQLEHHLALSFFRPGTRAYDQAQAAAQREARGEEGGGRFPGLPGLPSLPDSY